MCYTVSSISTGTEIENVSLLPVRSYIAAPQTTDRVGFTLLPVEDPLIVEHQALPRPHSHPVPEIPPPQQVREHEGVRRAGLRSQCRSLGGMFGHADLFRIGPPPVPVEEFQDLIADRHRPPPDVRARWAERGEDIDRR